MSADPQNDFRQGDLKHDLWRKILSRLQAQSIGTTLPANLAVQGDEVTALERKVLTQLQS